MKVIATSNAPAAVGPYSQAIVSGNLLFVSGQIPLVPGTPNFAGDDITAQAHQSLKNVKAIVEAAGAKMSDVVKTTVLLTDLADFATVNAIYAEYFTEPCPARACFQVAALPKGAKIEIEAIVEVK